jgi:hypothetical protein
MAVVVPTPQRTAIGEIIIPKKSAKSVQLTCWTGTEKTNNRIKSRLSRMQADWTKDVLDGALTGAENSSNVIGIRCPQPLGIITFEDIIGTILQKTNREERNFYSCHSNMAKGKKAGDCGTISTVHEIVSRPQVTHMN